MDLREYWLARVAPFAFFLLSYALALPAQTSLSLASGTVPVGGNVALGLSLSSGVIKAATVQWTFTYTPTDFNAISVSLAPSVASAAKTLTCFGTSGSYTCLISGLNTNTIPNGVIATGNMALSSSSNPSRPVQITSPSSASSTAISVPASATGGLVIASPLVVLVSALNCTPASVTGPATAACTVTLSSAAPIGGALVTLSDSSASVTTPASVTVAAGNTTAAFTATTSAVTTSTTATITASLGGSSSAFTLVSWPLPFPPHWPAARPRSARVELAVARSLSTTRRRLLEPW